jgi:hypothetical protein
MAKCLLLVDRYTCTPHDAPGSRRAAILARGSVNTQHLQPMKVLEPAAASSVSGGVNTKPLQPDQAPVAPTSRKKHCTARATRGYRARVSRAASCATEPLHGGVKPAFSNRASCPRTRKPLALKSTRYLQQSTGGRDVAIGAAVDIMLPSAQSATKHLNAPQSSTTPTWFAKS